MSDVPMGDYLDLKIREAMRPVYDRLDRIDAALTGSTWFGFGESPEAYRDQILATLRAADGAPDDAADAAEAAADTAQEAAAVALDAADAAEAAADAADDAADADDDADGDDDEPADDDDETDETGGGDAGAAVLETPPADATAPRRDHALRRPLFGRRD